MFIHRTLADDGNLDTTKGDLVHAVQRCYERLPKEIQAELPLKRVGPLSRRTSRLLSRSVAVRLAREAGARGRPSPSSDARKSSLAVSCDSFLRRAWRDCGDDRGFRG
jgi:hypothetical protein